MIDWRVFVAWIGVGLLGLALLADELLGIAHVWGLQPITDDAERSPLLAILIGALGPVFVAWWIVHLRNNRPP